VRVVEQAWAADLGWYTQRAVDVAGDQLDSLIEQLLRVRAARRSAAARANTRANRGGTVTPTAAGAGGRSGGGKVLPFRPR
jgi:hypothetical protein